MLEHNAKMWWYWGLSYMWGMLYKTIFEDENNKKTTRQLLIVESILILIYQCKVDGAPGDGTAPGTCASDSVCKADGSCAGTNYILPYELYSYL